MKQVKNLIKKKNISTIYLFEEGILISLRQ